MKLVEFFKNLSSKAYFVCYNVAIPTLHMIRFITPRGTTGREGHPNLQNKETFIKRGDMPPLFFVTLLIISRIHP